MSFRIVNGSSYTENGWRCCDRNECDIPRIPNLFFTDTAPIRKGAPLTILGAWLFWYDRNVEEITSSVWSWSLSNDVLGQYGANNGSNHLSATAIDVNAPKYPWGSRTMSAAKKAKVREGQKLFSLDGNAQNSLVFWGADWNRADEMHYQMRYREGDARNDKFAQKLRDGYLGIYKPDPNKPKPEVPKPEPEKGVLMALTDAEQKELLDGVRYIRDQIGPGFDGWGEDGDLGTDSKGRRNTLRSALAKFFRISKAV